MTARMTPQSLQDSRLDYEVATHTLANGLRVVVSSDHNVPTVAVNLWVGVGSRHEVPGATGLAHLFEHLMFQGSRNVAEGEHFSRLQAAGARLNATTWFDRTNYFEVVPTGAMELALWMEADRHGYLLDALTQTNLDNQRDVVKEEKRQRYDNRPYGNALADIYGAVFPEGHPYHHSTIGSMDDLDAASLQDVQAFYSAHYRPSNTVLTLCGDVQPQAGFEAAQKYFGGLPDVERPGLPVSTPLPPLTSPTTVERVEDVPSDRIYLGFRLPADRTQGTCSYLAAELALDLLAGMATSRLHRRVVRREHAADHVFSNSFGLAGGVSLGLLGADVAAGHRVEQVQESIREELVALAQTPPTDDEMQVLRAGATRQVLQAFASIEERADFISQYTLLHDEPGYLNTHLGELLAITPEQIQDTAAQFLAPEHAAAVIYRREDAS